MDSYQKKYYIIKTLNDEEVYFSGWICTASMVELVYELKKCESKFLSSERENFPFTIPTMRPIRLHIFSCGGLTMDAFYAVDQLKMLKVPVHTIVSGHASSAATLLSIIGNQRFITKNAYMMIHAIRFVKAESAVPESVVPADQVVFKHFNGIDIHKQVIQHYVAYTKLSSDSLEKIFSEPDRYWNAEECLERGFVDKIL